MQSIETRRSWVVGLAALVCLGMSFGSPLVAAVGLKTIAAEMGGARSVPALAGSLAWLGLAAGGIPMGRLADRFGIRSTVIFGAVMICVGLYVSTFGQPWHMYVGHGLFVGFLGYAGLNAPLYVYVSRWFDRRRGSALALISSGGYIAGFLWPTIMARAIDSFGWRWTMIGYGVLVAIIVVPLASIFFTTPPEAPSVAAGGEAARKPRLFGWSPNLVFCLLSGASFLCCIPMAMPQGHLVALCSDLGLSVTVGAAMLSVLLGAGFVSRQGWGLISDRIGGLRTALVSSALQAAAVTGFLYVREEAGLFAVSFGFGVGFSALIPAYVLTVRELFPLSEAHWRVPTILLMTGSGMAMGGWLAGYLYDHFGYYGPSFSVGLGANLVNLGLLGVLVLRQYARPA